MTTLITKDEIIEMAKQSLLASWHKDLKKWQIEQGVEAFAKLVEDKVRQEIIEKNAPVIKKVNEHIKELQDAVKAEREACAIACETDGKDLAGLYYAGVIRARSQ